jgi:sugar phosphate permease
MVGVLLAISFGLASASDGSFWAATIDAGGENTGAACGVLNTGSNIGGFIAPVLTPFIASLAGWTSAMYFACLVAAVGVTIWFLLETPKLKISNEYGVL